MTVDPAVVEPMFLVESPFTPLVGALVGVVLLLAGRRLFWLLVAAVGFVVGFHLASRWLGMEEVWLQVLVGVLCGLAGAFLAVLLQRVAIALVGFFLGGSLGGWLAETVFGLSDTAGWIVFVVAGIVAAILAGAVFELALVVLSSLLGASLLVQAAGDLPLEMGDTTRVVAFLVLAALGMAAQALQPRREVELERAERLRRQEERRRGG